MNMKLRYFVDAFLLVVFCCLSLNIAKSQSLIELVPCALNSSQTETLVTRIDVGEQPLHLAINPTAKKIYVTNFVDDTVSVIDSETNAVLKTISVGRLNSVITPAVVILPILLPVHSENHKFPSGPVLIS